MIGRFALGLTVVMATVAPRTSVTLVRLASRAVGSSLTAHPVAARARRDADPVGCAMPWRRVATPDTGGLDRLRGMVALSPSDIWIVGSTEDGGGSGTLVEHWDGARWRVVDSPANGGRETRLSGVAAVSATDIWAVGDYVNADGAGPLTEHWDGRRWRVVPDAASGPGITLNAVAAVARDDVWAVGAARGGAGTLATLVERWDGHRWRIVTGPGHGSLPAGLTAVTAVARDDVWVLGPSPGRAVTGSGSLVEHWDGAHWRVVPTPDPGPMTGGGLSSIAAVSARDVWAVGAVARYAATSPLIEHWDGVRWRIVPGPRPAEAGMYGLAAVTAIAAHDVWAVGSAGVAGPALVEHWDGARWREMPAPPGAPATVAASSAGNVWMAGMLSGDDIAPYVARYSGTPCYAVDPFVRAIPAGRYPFALGADPARGRLFVRDDDGMVDVVDTARGTLLRRTAVGPYDYGDYLPTSTAVDRRAGRVFVANSGDTARDGDVSVLDAATGKVLRTVATGVHPVAVTVNEQRGHVFVVNAGPLDTGATGSVSMLDARTGAILHTAAVGRYPDAAAVDTRTGRLFVVSREDSTVSVLDAARGTRLSTVRVAGVPAAAALAVAERAGRVFVAGQGGAINVLDAASGRVGRAIRVGGGSGTGSVTALAVDERSGRLFAGWDDDQGGHVRMLDAGTGRVLRTVDVGAVPTVLAVDATAGKIFATGAAGAPGSGAVSVLDARTGALLTTVGTGDNTAALAMDERAGRVFVLSRGDAGTLFRGSVTVIDADAGGTTTGGNR